MSKIFLFVLFFGAISPAFGQAKYYFKVVDADTKSPLAYVNVGIPGKKSGTVTNEAGTCSLGIITLWGKDSLTISSIGYFPKSLLIESIIERPNAHDTLTIALQKQVYQLREAVVRSHEYSKPLVIGSTYSGKAISGGFYQNSLGSELGFRVEVKKHPYLLKKFSCNIASNKFDTVVFRLNIYTLKDGLPSKNILAENVIATFNQKSGKLDIDLSPYYIELTESVVISLEWIKDLGPVDGLQFSFGLLGNGVYYRNASQQYWEKSGKGTPGFNVTVLK